MVAKEPDIDAEIIRERDAHSPLDLKLNGIIQAEQRVRARRGHQELADKLAIASTLVMGAANHAPRKFDEFIESLKGTRSIEILKPALDEVRNRDRLTRQAKETVNRNRTASDERDRTELRSLLGASPTATNLTLSTGYRNRGLIEVSDEIDKNLLSEALDQALRLLGDARENSSQFATALGCDDSVKAISRAIKSVSRRAEKGGDQEKIEAACLLRDLWWGAERFSEHSFSDAITAI